MFNRPGRSWYRIDGSLMQIDSGPFGMVYGVNSGRYIFCRTGITWKNPKGSKWRHVPGRLKYVSAGLLGLWGVTYHNYVYFRFGVSRRNPQGIVFIDIYLLQKRAFFKVTFLF